MPCGWSGRTSCAAMRRMRGSKSSSSRATTTCRRWGRPASVSSSSPGDPARPFPRDRVSPMASSDQIRLLLIEDVPQVAKYVKSLLAPQAQIRLLDIIDDGSRALGLLDEERPDVI